MYSRCCHRKFLLKCPIFHSEFSVLSFVEITKVIVFVSQEVLTIYATFDFEFQVSISA